MTQSSENADNDISQLSLPEGQYEGEVQDQHINGIGIYIWNNGDVYYGEWVSGKMHGKGIFCYASGEYLEGNFLMNSASGPGCLTFPDGSFLKGIFHNGKLQGRAMKYDAKDDKWVIEDFVDGRLDQPFIEGQGKPMQYDFWSNVSDSRGTDDSGSKDKFDLKFTTSQEIIFDNSYPPKTKVGVIEFDSHTRFFGVTKNRTPEGLGLVISSKEVIMGVFSNGRLNGQGRRISFGESYYKGSFVEGEFSGKGTLYSKDGMKKITATFKEGEIQKVDVEEDFTIEDLNDLMATYNQTTPLNREHLVVRNFENSLCHQENFNRPLTPTPKSKKNEYNHGIAPPLKSLENKAFDSDIPEAEMNFTNVADKALDNARKFIELFQSRFQPYAFKTVPYTLYYPEKNGESSFKILFSHENTASEMNALYHGVETMPILQENLGPNNECGYPVYNPIDPFMNRTGEISGRPHGLRGLEDINSPIQKRYTPISHDSKGDNPFENMPEEEEETKKQGGNVLNRRDSFAKNTRATDDEEIPDQQNTPRLNDPNSKNTNKDGKKKTQPDAASNKKGSKKGAKGKPEQAESPFKKFGDGNADKKKSPQNVTSPQAKKGLGDKAAEGEDKKRQPGSTTDPKKQGGSVDPKKKGGVPATPENKRKQQQEGSVDPKKQQGGVNDPKKQQGGVNDPKKQSPADAKNQRGDGSADPKKGGKVDPKKQPGGVTDPKKQNQQGDETDPRKQQQGGVNDSKKQSPADAKKQHGDGSVDPKKSGKVDPKKQQDQQVTDPKKQAGANKDPKKKQGDQANKGKNAGEGEGPDSKKGSQQPGRNFGDELNPEDAKEGDRKRQGADPNSGKNRKTDLSESRSPVKEEGAVKSPLKQEGDEEQEGSDSKKTGVPKKGNKKGTKKGAKKGGKLQQPKALDLSEFSSSNQLGQNQGDENNKEGGEEDIDQIQPNKDNQGDQSNRSGDPRSGGRDLSGPNSQLGTDREGSEKRGGLQNKDQEGEEDENLRNNKDNEDPNAQDGLNKQGGEENPDNQGEGIDYEKYRFNPFDERQHFDKPLIDQDQPQNQDHGDEHDYNQYLINKESPKFNENDPNNQGGEEGGLTSDGNNTNRRSGGTDDETTPTTISKNQRTPNQLQQKPIESFGNNNQMGGGPDSDKASSIKGDRKIGDELFGNEDDPRRPGGEEGRPSRISYETDKTRDTKFDSLKPGHVGEDPNQPGGFQQRPGRNFGEEDYMGGDQENELREGFDPNNNNQGNQQRPGRNFGDQYEDPYGAGQGKRNQHPYDPNTDDNLSTPVSNKQSRPGVPGSDQINPSSQDTTPSKKNGSGGPKQFKDIRDQFKLAKSGEKDPAKSILGGIPQKYLKDKKPSLSTKDTTARNNNTATPSKSTTKTRNTPGNLTPNMQPPTPTSNAANKNNKNILGGGPGSSSKKKNDSPQKLNNNQIRPGRGQNLQINPEEANADNPVWTPKRTDALAKEIDKKKKTKDSGSKPLGEQSTNKKKKQPSRPKGRGLLDQMSPKGNNSVQSTPSKNKLLKTFSPATTETKASTNYKKSKRGGDQNIIPEFDPDQMRGGQFIYEDPSESERKRKVKLSQLLQGGGHIAKLIQKREKQQQQHSNKTSKTTITRDPTSRRKPRTPKFDLGFAEMGTSLTYVDTTGRSTAKPHMNKSSSRNRYDPLREVVSPYPLIDEDGSPLRHKSVSPYDNHGGLNTSSSQHDLHKHGHHHHHHTHYLRDTDDPDDPYRALVFSLYPVKKTCDPRVDEQYYDSLSVSPSKRSRSNSRSFHSRSVSRGLASVDGDRSGFLKRSGDHNFALGSSMGSTQPQDKIGGIQLKNIFDAQGDQQKYSSVPPQRATEKTHTEDQSFGQPVPVKTQGSSSRRQNPQAGGSVPAKNRQRDESGGDNSVSPGPPQKANQKAMDIQASKGMKINSPQEISPRFEGDESNITVKRGSGDTDIEAILGGMRKGSNFSRENAPRRGSKK